MDYLCAKFDYFNFSRFGFIVRTESHTDKGGRSLYSRDYRRREYCIAQYVAGINGERG